MSPIVRRGVAFAVWLLVLAAGASPCLAAWLPNGNPVCTAPGAQRSPAAIGDGAGGVIVAWNDGRPGAPGIYAQRLLGDGGVAPGWPVNGVLCSGASPAGAPAIVPDGAGGALIVWLGAAIRVQRVDANGSLHAGWPADGKVVTADVFTNGHAQYVAVVTDGSGGAYVTWVVYNPITFWHQLRLSRIGPGGAFAPGWSESGAHLVASESVTLYGLAADPAGGVIAAFGNYVNAQVDSRHGTIVRVRPDGTRAFTAAATAYDSGNLAPYGIFHVAAVSDSAGGAYGSWTDVSATVTRRFDQRFGPGGASAWAGPHLAPLDERLLRDGGVGVWHVGRAPGTERLEVHRRLDDGSLPPGWSAAGVAVSAPVALGAVAAATFPTVVVLCWAENTVGAGFDVRALSVRQDGVIPPGWSPGGTVIGGAPGHQIAPVLVLEGSGAIACWEDERPSASVADIYASRIQPLVTAGVPPAAGGFALLGAWPNPARDRIRAEIMLEHGARARIELVDVAGRRLRAIEIAGAGRRVVELDCTGAAPGVYWLRLEQDGRSLGRRVAIVR